MNVQEAAPVALPDRARPLRWGYYAVRALLVVVLLASAAFLPRDGGPASLYRYREGDIARERVVAPYAFRVEKDEPTLRREQEAAASAVPPVFVVDTRLTSEMFGRFSTFHEKALAVVLDPGLSVDERRIRVRALGVPLTAESAAALMDETRARRVLDGLGTWLQRLYEVGVVPEKRGDMLLGYRNVTVREGDGESSRSTAQIYDRHEAQQLIDRQAHDAFPTDPRGVRLAD
jgi:hypothetical protein